MKYVLVGMFALAISCTNSRMVTQSRRGNKIITQLCISNNKITDEWKRALVTRMTKQEIDSLAHADPIVSNGEKKWIQLIEARAYNRKAYADSIKNIFLNSKIPDTVYIYLGHSGGDDAFTYGHNAVCMDLAALQNNYGDATLIENTKRIDRLFAHELTHLLHKEWANRHKLKVETFKDSVLWECLYEGLGMYRSLSAKWLPQNGELPEMTKKTLSELNPVFVDRLVETDTTKNINETTRKKISANLSRGPVPKKWGAFPMAIWLALEANGDDRKLISWTEDGPLTVIRLAKKYLTGNDKKKFETVFGDEM